MKKIISLAIVIFLAFSISITCSAAPDHVNDSADLLTDSEERELRATLGNISDKYGAQVAVVTVNSLGTSIDYYVNDVYDSKNYGYGTDKAGVLLLVCMDQREYRILSNGMAADAITSYDIDSISDAIVPYLSGGDYAEAFDTYARECDYYLNGYINGFPFDFSTNLILALIVGAIVGLIVVSCFKAQLRSVRAQNQANAYVKAGSMNITRAGDYFMYRTVSRRPRPQNNSSSSSSSRSGGSRNVGGGRF